MLKALGRIPLIRFLSEHKALYLIVVPAIVIAGQFNVIAALVVAFLAGVYFLRTKKEIDFILLYLLILFLADSRESFFQFAKALRIELLLLGCVATVTSFKNLRLPRLVLHILPFFFIGMLALLNSPEAETAMMKTVSYLLTVYFILAFGYNILAGKWTELLNAVVFNSLFLLTIQLLLIPVLPGMVFYLDSIRFSGLLGNPNGLGVYITVMTPLIVLAFTLSPEQFPRKIWYFVIIFLNLLLCASRTSFLSVFIFLLCYFALRGSLKRKVIIFAGVIPSLIILLLIIPWYDIILFLGLQDYFRLETIEDASGRYFAWKYGWDLIQEFPWIGRGFAFEEYAFRQEHMPYELYVTGHQGGVHSSVIAMLINTGFLGLFSFIYFIFMMVRKPLKKYFPFAASLLVAITASAIFESWLMASLNTFTIYFLLILMILNYIHLEREEGIPI